MKNKWLLVIVLSSIIFVFFHSISYANSSWHWVTSSPLTVLPFAVIITLLVEIIAVTRVGMVSNLKKAFITIATANLVSFLLPYFVRAYRFIPVSGGFSLLAAFKKGPYFIVLLGYLLLTLLVELPIVYLLLKQYTQKKTKFMVSVVISNVMTTLLVAVCERLICIGRW